MLTGPLCFLGARLFLVIYNHCCLKGLLSATVTDITTTVMQLAPVSTVSLVICVFMLSRFCAFVWSCVCICVW